MHLRTSGFAETAYPQGDHCGFSGNRTEFKSSQRKTARSTKGLTMEQYAYRQAPWRKQVKTILNFLIGLIVAVGFASLYLYYSAQMTDMKLQIQVLHEERNNLTRTIADYVTREGILTSFSYLRQKAQQNGYQPIDYYNEDIYEYQLIDGYYGEKAVAAKRAVEKSPLPVSPLRPEYSLSLQQWLQSKLKILRNIQ